MTRGSCGQVPGLLARLVLWLVTHAVYRIRVEGQQHVPFRGPALLVCNHVSHVGTGKVDLHAVRQLALEKTDVVA